MSRYVKADSDKARSLINKTGLQISSVCELCDESPSWINNMRKNKVRRSSVERLAKLLGIKASDLIIEDERVAESVPVDVDLINKKLDTIIYLLKAMNPSQICFSEEDLR